MKDPLYAVIDTNVIVSAALRWNSIPGSIIQAAMRGTIHAFTDSTIVAEYLEVLQRPKFGFPTFVSDTIVNGILEYGSTIERIPTKLSLPDPKDLPFFEVTLTARRSIDCHLVTGNKKHFPNEPFVLSPREYLTTYLHPM